jgi:tRNA1Val (adenine37-N6)-methyltransferase
MKIGTDAVLLGAWVTCANETRILDIGSGSGILALMMAQRNPNTTIDAIEIEYEASMLSKENFRLSPWSSSIDAYHISAQQFCSDTQNKYSLIICNPPFFTDSLKSPGESRNLARHNDTLSVSDLLEITAELLTDEGKASFVIPADALGKWKHEASGHGLFTMRLNYIRSSPAHKVHRVLITFTRVNNPVVIEDDIYIYNADSTNSSVYKDITKDFYLYF